MGIPHKKKNHNFFEFSSKIEGMAHKNEKFDFKNEYIE